MQFSNKIILFIIIGLCFSESTLAQDTARFKKNKLTLCFNDTTEFINTSTENCGIPTSYFWDFGDTTTGAIDTSTLKNPRYRYLNIGLYKATLIVNWVCAPPDTITKNVNIQVIPPPNIFLSGLSPTISCPNSPVQFAVFIGGTTLYYDWGDGALDTTNLGNLSHSYSIPGFYTVEVIAENACGKDTVYSPQLEIITPPVAPDLFVPDTVCDNALFDVYSLTVIPVAYSYQWITKEGGYRTGLGFADTVIQIQATKGAKFIKVTLNQLNSIGCPSFGVNDTVYLKPSPNKRDIIGSKSVCENTIVKYAIEGNNGSTYKWFCSGGVIIGSDSTSQVDISWGNNGIGNIDVIEFNPLGCFGDTNKLIININLCNSDVPNSSLFAISPSIDACSGLLTVAYVGEIIQFIDESTNDPTEWYWEFPGGVPNTSNLQYPKITYNVAGTYDVHLRTKNIYGFSKKITFKNYIEIVNPADNLVPNSSFENFTTCPDWFSQFQGNVLDWFVPTAGTSDYFNSCAGTVAVIDAMDVPRNIQGAQSAKEGNAYAGIISYNSASWREYLEVELTKPLEPCKSYCINFYINQSEKSEYAITEMGLLFSTGPVTSGGLIMIANPQIISPPGQYIEDKDNWMLISGTYTAIGGEDHITIGNFKSQASVIKKVVPMTGEYAGGSGGGTAYHFIDDVHVVEMGSSATIMYENVTCYGEQTGNAEAIAYNKSINHDYSWNTVPVTNDSVMQNQNGGDYISTINNNKGCVFIDTITIDEPDSLDFNFDIMAPCSITDSGTLTALVTGGVRIYDYDWSPNINSTDSVINTTPGTYQLIITDLYGCIDSEQVIMPTNPGLTISFASNAVCEGDSTIVTSSVSGLAAGYNWSGMLSSIDSNLVFIHGSAGTFPLTLSVLDTFNCLFSYTDNVTVYDIPATYNLDTIGCTGNILLLGQSSTNTLEWFENNSIVGTSVGLVFSENVSADKNYLTVADNGNCIGDTGMVTIDAISCEFFIPNAFSPNGDGENDLFRVRGEGVTNYNIRIYDRWGNRVFDSKDINEIWDGSANNKGVYVYYLKATLLDGSQAVLTGNITLAK